MTGSDPNDSCPHATVAPFENQCFLGCHPPHLTHDPSGRVAHESKSAPERKPGIQRPERSLDPFKPGVPLLEKRTDGVEKVLLAYVERCDRSIDSGRGHLDRKPFAPVDEFPSDEMEPVRRPLSDQLHPGDPCSLGEIVAYPRAGSLDADGLLVEPLSEFIEAMPGMLPFQPLPPVGEPGLYFRPCRCDPFSRAAWRDAVQVGSEISQGLVDLMPDAGYDGNPRGPNGPDQGFRIEGCKVLE